MVISLLYALITYSYVIYKTECSHQAPSLIAQEVRHPDNAESHQHVSENVPPVEDNSAAKTSNQSKQEVLPPFGGSQFSLIQTPDYNFGLVPQVLNPHLVQFEGSDKQACLFVSN